MRWKVLFFEKESETTFKYGFKTRKCPPQHKEWNLMEFEDDLQKMISNVQFRCVTFISFTMKYNHLNLLMSMDRICYPY